MKTIRPPAHVVGDEPSGGEDALLDEKTVATMHELKLVARLYLAFIAALPGQLAALRTAMAAQDRSAIRWQAHKLRGASSQLGAAALARVFGEIEAAVEDGADGEFSRADARLDELVRATTAALMREVESAR